MCQSVEAAAASPRQTLSINIAPSGPIRHAAIFLHQQIKVSSINPLTHSLVKIIFLIDTNFEMSVTGEPFLCQKMKGLKLK